MLKMKINKKIKNKKIKETTKEFEHDCLSQVYISKQQTLTKTTCMSVRVMFTLYALWLRFQLLARTNNKCNLSQLVHECTEWDWNTDTENSNNKQHRQQRHQQK